MSSQYTASPEACMAAARWGRGRPTVSSLDWSLGTSWNNMVTGLRGLFLYRPWGTVESFRPNQMWGMRMEEAGGHRGKKTRGSLEVTWRVVTVSLYSHPQYLWGTGSRTPPGEQIYRCSSPSIKWCSTVGPLNPWFHIHRWGLTVYRNKQNKEPKGPFVGGWVNKLCYVGIIYSC